MNAAAIRSEPSEAEFTTQVIQFAQLLGWLVHHSRPAMTGRGWRTPLQGDAGAPDLLLAKNGRVVLIELKVGKNKPSELQRRWIEASGAKVFTPNDWDEIERLLGRSA